VFHPNNTTGHPSQDPSILSALQNYSRFQAWLQRDPFVGGGFTRNSFNWAEPKRKPWWFGLLELEMLTLEPQLHDDVRLVKISQNHGYTTARNYGPEATASLICFLADRYKKRTRLFHYLANAIRANMLFPTNTWDQVWNKNLIEKSVLDWQKSGRSNQSQQKVDTPFGPVVMGPSGPEVRGAAEYRDPFARAVASFVQHTFPYSEEVYNVEWIRTPLKQLWDACYLPYVVSSDCDDLTLMTNLLLECLGIPTAVMLAGDPGGGPKYHVYSVYESDPRNGTWKVCDTSSPTPFREMNHGGNYTRFRTNNPEDWMPIVYKILQESPQ